MKVFFLLFNFLLILNISFAQHQHTERCRSSRLAHTAMKNNPKIAEKRAEIQRFTQEWIRSNQSMPRMEINLPVVVHVLYSSNEENISEEQIQSQIAVLNEDFNMLNEDSNNTPDAFKALRGSVGVNFCLASVDPQGNPTNGITRRAVTDKEIGETQDFFSTERGGTDAWDNSKYINIWVANQEDGSLGFASLPGTAEPPESDGMVIPSLYFGRTGTAANSSPNNLGKTGTHEMGHYLGLEHIWGGHQSGCDLDDNVDDTPSQFTESQGCNTFPSFDDCTTSGNGIMFMNYMDYSDDACMTMFSAGQAAVMQSVIMGTRAGLMSAGMTACTSTTTNTEDIIFNELKIYPNPAHESITIDLGVELSRVKNVELVNIAGQIVRQQNKLAQSQLNVANLTRGIYLLKIKTDTKVHSSKIIIK